MKYTIDEFLTEYPDSEACLEKIFKFYVRDLPACPKCGVCDPKFKPVKGRRSYRCVDCDGQVYPTKGTIFERTRVPLRKWFIAMYLMTTSRNGVSAAELQRTLGITYKCAWRMGHQIRILMAAGLYIRQLIGSVEVDETLIGGKEKNKHRDKRTKGNQGMSLKTKSGVFGMVERSGEVRALHVSAFNTATVMPIIANNVGNGTYISSDESHLYNYLCELEYYEHGHVNHRRGQYKAGKACTNTIEGFFSCLKRTLHGSYISVSKKYLQRYVDECCYRYNRRGLKGMMFMDLLSQISWADRPSLKAA